MYRVEKTTRICPDDQELELSDLDHRKAPNMLHIFLTDETIWNLNLKEDPVKLKRAKELMAKGDEVFRRKPFEEAHKLYSQSVQLWPTSASLCRRAAMNLKLGRNKPAYLDAVDALRLGDKKCEATAIELHNMAEKNMLMDQVEIMQRAKGSRCVCVPKKRIMDMFVANKAFQPDNCPISIVCMEEDETHNVVPLLQLDEFLNERVEGTVQQVVFIYHRFDEQSVQVFGRVNGERFMRVCSPDGRGVQQKGYQWTNCDFSKLSEGSFRLLLDKLFYPASFCLSEWTGMPRGFTYNSLFKLRAFKEAAELSFDFGNECKPDVNIKLDSDSLIDFLHSQGYRCLYLLDCYLQDGFDAFMNRLTQRFQEDTESRFYEVCVTVLNATASMKNRLKLGKPLILQHPKEPDQLQCELSEPFKGPVLTRGFFSSANMSEYLLAHGSAGVFEFQARRIRGPKDTKAVNRYHCIAYKFFL